MEQDIPDYDMDSEDEKWVAVQSRKMDLTPLQFEEMMDRLEKSSGQTVVTLNEAKALLKEDDDLIIAVFDYWLNKRLKTVSFYNTFMRVETTVFCSLKYIIRNNNITKKKNVIKYNVFFAATSFIINCKNGTSSWFGC